MRKKLTLSDYLENVYRYEVRRANEGLLKEIKKSVNSMYDQKIPFPVFYGPKVHVKGEKEEMSLSLLFIRNGHLYARIQNICVPGEPMNVPIKDIIFQDIESLTEKVIQATAIPESITGFASELPRKATRHSHTTLLSFLGKSIGPDMVPLYYFLCDEGVPYRAKEEELIPIPTQKPKIQHYYRATFWVYKRGEMNTRPLAKPRIIQAPNAYDAYKKAQETCDSTLLRHIDDVAVCRKKDIIPILKDEAMTYKQKDIIK